VDRLNERIGLLATVDFRVMHFAEFYAASRYKFRSLGDSSFALG
jgi:hypothetical protein